MTDLSFQLLVELCPPCTPVKSQVEQSATHVRTPLLTSNHGTNVYRLSIVVYGVYLAVDYWFAIHCSEIMDPSWQFPIH